MKKIMILGSGGREHALGWKLGQSDQVLEVIYAPGNGGTAEGKGRNIEIDGSKKENFPKLFDIVNNLDIDMVIVGPEVPLANGIVDYFNFRGYDRIFGPTQKASLLESDKFFSYDLMEKTGIPQANSIKCYSKKEAVEAIEKMASDRGVVIKARGLTQGKGVLVCGSKEQALMGINNHLRNYGSEVLISERLYGEEFSVFGICDGERVSPLEISLQDHKPLLDEDKGPNTGGMGAYGPAPIASREMVKKITKDFMHPLINKMKEQGIEYKGFIYGGVIMTESGPKIIEFNVRFGDPECQPAMAIVRNDLYRVLSLSLEGKLNQVEMEFNRGASCCVVLASKGYPEKYKKGLEVRGLDYANEIEGVKVFHAGTRVDNGRILTSGGRVFGVNGYSQYGIKKARELAYEGVSKISVLGDFHYRKDIANKALRLREK
jgi:phosphoribosylamine---glycine ligase